MSSIKEGGGTRGDAPVPILPKAVAVPVAPGNSFYEQLAAPLIPRPDGEGHDQRDARRYAARLPEGYRPTSGADLTFDPRIAYELALGVSSPAAVFEKYGCTLEEATALLKSPFFIDTIKKYQKEVTESGITFRLKAKIQAEDLLTHSYILATDNEVPAAVRADLIKWTAKMAGLEPSEKEKGGGGAGGAGFTLNITLASPGSPGSAPMIEVNMPEGKQ